MRYKIGRALIWIIKRILKYEDATLHPLTLDSRDIQIKNSIAVRNGLPNWKYSHPVVVQEEWIRSDGKRATIYAMSIGNKFEELKQIDSSDPI